MKKIILFVSFLIILPLVHAKENAGELSLPWTAFEKLLELNEDQIALTWDEFQQLMKQTGLEKTPHFQMQNGNVILSRQEFKTLLKKMKPPASAAPKYYLTKAVYSGTINKKQTLVTAHLRLQIPKSEKNMAPLRMELFAGQMAFQEILLNGRPALIENENRRTYITVTKPGNHQIAATFSVTGSLEKAPFHLYFSVPRTPITQLDFTLPLRNVDVKVDNASLVEKIKRKKSTRIKASLTPVSSVKMSWNPIEVEKAKGPAKTYSSTYELLAIEEDAIRVQTRLDLNVLQNTINALNVQVPEGYNVLEVNGDSVGEWKVQGKDKKVLLIPLRYARQGRFYVNITSERVFKGKNSVIDFSGFHVMSAIRENGFLGVELKTTAEAKIIESKGLTRQDIQELPRMLLNLSPRPFVYGFKYTHPPFQLGLDIQRHEEVPVISTVVDEANGVTLIMQDGKRVHHLTYSVRNTWKQFLELQVPEDAQVWSTFVQGQRVKPSKNQEGKILIPLNRSKNINGDLSQFDVEIMYYQSQKSLRPAGRESIEFLIPDIVVSQALWSVYLPVNNDYLYFRGTADKEKSAQGIRPLVSILKGEKRILKNLVGMDFDNGYRYSSDKPASMELKKQRIDRAKNTRQWQSRGSFSEGQSVKDEAYARQVERELNFFNQALQQGNKAIGGGTAPGVTGVLPIRVNVPNAGQVFRFTKKIVVNQAPLTLDIFYANQWTVKALKLFLLIVLIWVLFKLKSKWILLKNLVLSFYKNHENEIKWVLSPGGLVITTALLWGAGLIFTRLTAVMGFLLFAGALLRWLWTLLKRKRENEINP